MDDTPVSILNVFVTYVLMDDTSVTERHSFTGYNSQTIYYFQNKRQYYAILS